jgi:hypothetical protein
MFSDEILGLVLDVGHKKSAIGYIGDEFPRYSTASLAGTPYSEGAMDIELGGSSKETSSLLFGENLTCKYEQVKYHRILKDEASKHPLTQFRTSTTMRDS